MRKFWMVLFEWVGVGAFIAHEAIKPKRPSRKKSAINKPSWYDSIDHDKENRAN